LEIDISSALEYALLGLYFIFLSVLFVFGVQGYVMVYLYRKHQPKDKRKPEWQGDWPLVTIQLPIYNELYVVERLLRAVCAMDYPRDRLQIQVLDDSTDESRLVAERLVRSYQERGYDIVHLHRTDRVGYKAGALREGLKSAKGEFIAIFDADFVPPKKFLRQTIPHFVDPKLGLVQARWGYINDDYSLLTRAQAIALDGHFVIEQAARNRAGYFMNFNGTGGVWRKACILDAGNWSDDTLTEDLDLSYRAQLRGWRFKYLQDVVCPSEVPAEMNSVKSQQFRWTKGAIETARKILPEVWRAALPLGTKIQATLHLSNNLVFAFILLVSLLNLPVLLLKLGSNDHQLYFAVSSFFVLAFFGSFLMYLFSQREVYPDWRRRIRYFPVFMAGSMGLAVNNTLAIIEGLLRRRSPFVRTPKFHIVDKRDGWVDKKYFRDFNPALVLEVLLAIYCFAAVAVAVVNYEVAAVPFQLLFAFGYSFIAFLSIKHTVGVRLRNWLPRLNWLAVRSSEAFQSN
jgi:cellulose synthase/poly-beta-1,6-N-acetylglucosamine synthase-like glycosyltransferase